MWKQICYYFRPTHRIKFGKLSTSCKGKVKCERIFEEEYGRKGYIENKNIETVRDEYKSRFGMFPFAGNFTNDRRFARTEWLCRCKREKEEESHILSGNCEVYGEIRRSYGDIRDSDTLINFFNDILAHREKLEEEDKNNVKQVGFMCQVDAFVKHN